MRSKTTTGEILTLLLILLLFLGSMVLAAPVATLSAPLATWLGSALWLSYTFLFWTGSIVGWIRLSGRQLGADAYVAVRTFGAIIASWIVGAFVIEVFVPKTEGIGFFVWLVLAVATLGVGIRLAGLSRSGRFRRIRTGQSIAIRARLK